MNKVAATVAATALTADQARLLVPGLGEDLLLEDEEFAALLIQGGLVLDSHRYLRSVPHHPLTLTPIPPPPPDTPSEAWEVPPSSRRSVQLSKEGNF